MAQYIPNIVFQIVDSTSANVTGELEIQSATDFPLALTYSIKDVQDPQSSKGSFSKTFKIPATKKNNEILKNLYSDSLFDSYQYIENQETRIFIDGLLVLAGKFQIKGTIYKGIPREYECNVFGDNYRWVNRMSELNLCDIDFSAGNLFPNAPEIINYNKDAIEDTWEFGLAGETLTQGGQPTQTHIVYPLVNTGKWTEGNYVSAHDMQPAFYLYNVLKLIFAQQGYNLVSDFFESDWFRRLTSLIPKGEITNTVATLDDFAFEYEQGDVTPWKTPLHYQRTTGSPNSCAGVVGNTFHGGLQNMNMVNDPSGLITTQNVPMVRVDVQTPSNINAGQSTNIPCFSGWYWDIYSTAQFTGGRCAGLENSLCTGQPIIVGGDYSCIPCDIPNGSTTTQNVPLSTDAFQTNFLGIYEFNARVTVEMNNDYAIADPVINSGIGQTNFISIWGGGGFEGTGEGGYGTGLTSGNNNAQDPWDYEGFYNGQRLVANLFIMHYKADTDTTHAIVVDSQRLYAGANQNPTPPAGMWSQSYQMQPSSSGNYEWDLSFAGVQVEVTNQNDRVWIYTEVTAEFWQYEENNWAISGDVLALTQMKYRVKNAQFGGGLTATAIENGSFNLSNLLPCDVSQLDYVNGLTGMFNLMWQSDENSKTVFCEPRNGFFSSPANAIDWTDKLDKSENETNKYIYDALKRNLCFTYENDSEDGFVEERNLLKDQVCELGSHAMNLGDLYEDDDQKIGSDFYAPTYMFYDKTISTNGGAYKQPFIPVIHGEYTAIWSVSNPNDLPDKISEWTPRILIWYGLQPLNQIDGVTSSNQWKWGWSNNTQPYQLLDKYPFGGVYCDQDGTIGGSFSFGGFTYDSPSLYFENSDINAVPTNPPFAQTNGLYEMFWEFNILTLLDRPKIKTAFFKLTPYDIANLDYQKLIFLRSAQSDTYWILNKIIDYKGSKNVLTKVELFEYHNVMPLKSKFPTINTGYGVNLTPTFSDYTPIKINPNGTTKIPIKYINDKLKINAPFPTGNESPIKTTSYLPQNVNWQRSNPNGFSGGKNYFAGGTRVPVTGKLPNGISIGSDNKVVNNGGTAIGQGLTVYKQNQIVIGNKNNPASNRPIEFTQNGKTAMCVTNNGMFMEGGGGVVYYEDTTTGEMKEVMTGIPQTSKLKRQTTYYYTRVVKGNEDII